MKGGFLIVFVLCFGLRIFVKATSVYINRSAISPKDDLPAYLFLTPPRKNIVSVGTSTIQNEMFILRQVIFLFLGRFFCNLFRKWQRWLGNLNSVSQLISLQIWAFLPGLRYTFWISFIDTFIYKILLILHQHSLISSSYLFTTVKDFWLCFMTQWI